MFFTLPCTWTGMKRHNIGPAEGFLLLLATLGSQQSYVSATGIDAYSCPTKRLQLSMREEHWKWKDVGVPASFRDLFHVLSLLCASSSYSGKLGSWHLLSQGKCFGICGCQWIEPAQWSFSGFDEQGACLTLSVPTRDQAPAVPIWDFRFQR